MQFVKFGGSGTTGLGAVLPGVAVALEDAATDNQCSNVVLLIGLPPTCTTALLGIPPPHAERASEAKKMAPSAGIKRNVLDTTRAL
jgi:hypothetical protein